MLNNIYGFVQAGMRLFNIFYDDRFEQPEADPRVFHTFDDGEVAMVIVVLVDDILAHAQSTMERFAAKLGGKFKVKYMVEKFDVEKASRTHLLRGCRPSLKADEAQTPKDEEYMLKLLCQKAVGALMWTTTMTQPDIACAACAVARFWKKPGLVQKDSGVGYTLPASHARVGDHVR